MGKIGTKKHTDFSPKFHSDCPCLQWHFSSSLYGAPQLGEQKADPAYRDGSTSHPCQCEEQSPSRAMSLLMSKSLIHWFNGRFTDSLLHWFVDSLVYWSIGSLINDSLVHWFIGSLLHCFIPPLIHCFINPLIRWFIQSAVCGFFHVISLASQQPCAHSLVQRFVASASQKLSYIPSSSYSFSFFRNFRPGACRALLIYNI